MKFRKLLLSLRLWARACQSRRKEKRALAKIASLTKTFEKELIDTKKEYSERIIKIRNYYEDALWTERQFSKNQQKELLDRFLQLQHLPPLFSNPEDEKTAPISKTYQGNDDKITNSLSYDESKLLLDRKEQFWADGIELGKSEYEIKQAWEEKKLEVEQDVKLVFDNFEALSSNIS